MKPYICEICDEYRSADESPPICTEDGMGLICEECTCFCDCCDAAMPPAHTIIAYGIETLACNKCRGIPPEGEPMEANR